MLLLPFIFNTGGSLLFDCRVSEYYLSCTLGVNIKYSEYKSDKEEIVFYAYLYFISFNYQPNFIF